MGGDGDRMAGAVGSPDLSCPIVVLGAPRSGTTLLFDLLAQHPDVLALPEPRLVWRYGNDQRCDELRPEHATTKVIGHIRSRFAAALAESGKARLVEKSPANSVRPWFVDAVLPGARYVHITRNGWAAVPSIRRFWTVRGTGFDAKQRRKAIRRLREADVRQLPFYGREFARRLLPGSHGVPLYGPRLAGLQQIVNELGVLEAAGLQWRTCVDRSSTFGREIGPSRYIEVKLEELDREQFIKILEFCTLDPLPDVVRHFDQGYDRTSARKRVTLDADEVLRAAPLIEPANAFLGYRDDDCAPVPTAPRPAREQR